MSITTPSPRRLGRARNPHNGRRRRANFAQAAVFAEFRARDAKAILDVNFVDRRPDEMPRMSPEARR